MLEIMVFVDSWFSCLFIFTTTLGLIVKELHALHLIWNSNEIYPLFPRILCTVLIIHVLSLVLDHFSFDYWHFLHEEIFFYSFLNGKQSLSMVKCFWSWYNSIAFFHANLSVTLCDNQNNVDGFKYFSVCFSIESRLKNCGDKT